MTKRKPRPTAPEDPGQDVISELYVPREEEVSYWDTNRGQLFTAFHKRREARHEVRYLRSQLLDRHGIQVARVENEDYLYVLELRWVDAAWAESPFTIEIANLSARLGYWLAGLHSANKTIRDLWQRRRQDRERSSSGTGKLKGQKAKRKMKVLGLLPGWLADNPKGSRDGFAKYVERLHAHQRGFGSRTVNEIVSEFCDQIIAHANDDESIRNLSLARKAEAIAEQLVCQPGVTLQTVRFALK